MTQGAVEGAAPLTVNCGAPSIGLRLPGCCSVACSGPLIDCLFSADTVTIHDERCVLCVLQITDRKRSQDELVAAIEAVMADTSWFSRSSWKN
jgi:hypothetical protein